MPIYEYRCVECGDETEVIQRIDAAPKRRCGKCAGRLKKLISRTSFHLKGGGWFSEGYTRGSGKEPASKKASTESSTTTDSSSKDSTKSKEKKASSA